MATVIRSEDFGKYTWAIRVAGLLHRYSDVSKHEREINAVEVVTRACAWHRIHEPSIQHAHIQTEHIQTPRISLLELLLRADPVNKTKLGLT